MKKILLLIVMIVGLVLSGCGGGGDDSSSTVLEGTWTRGCNLDDGDYVTEKITFSGNSVYGYISHFTDSSCSENSKIITANRNADFTIGNSKTLSNGINVTDLEYYGISIRWTIENQLIVTNYNTRNYCGRSNWEIDKTYEVSACLNYPEKLYRIFKIDGDNLFFGDRSSDDSQDRLNTLESKFYTKQVM